MSKNPLPAKTGIKITLNTPATVSIYNIGSVVLYNLINYDLW